MKSFDIDEAYRKINEAVRFGIERLGEVGVQLQQIAQDGAKSVHKGWDSVDVPDFRKIDIEPVKRNFEENKAKWIVAGAVAVGLVVGLLIADSARKQHQR